MTDFAALLRAVAGHAVPDGLADAMARVLPSYGINTPPRIAHFVGQVCEETGGFRICVENLNYSAEGLLRVWPSHFTPAEAQAYAHQPERIANRAYASRMSNGDEASGDGWRFRGQGLLQITGRANFAQAAADTGLPLIDHPELLGKWGDASVAASAAFWRRAGCNELADADGLIPITRRINGGVLNLDTRRMYVGRAKAFLAAQASAPEPVAPVPQSVAPAAPDTPPDPPQPPAQDQPESPDVPRFARELWKAYGHRGIAWFGGIVTACAGFLHAHILELILFALLATLIALVLIVWTYEREKHRDTRERQLAASPPSNPEQSNVLRL